MRRSPAELLTRPEVRAPVLRLGLPLTAVCVAMPASAQRPLTFDGVASLSAPPSDHRIAYGTPNVGRDVRDERRPGRGGATVDALERPLAGSNGSLGLGSIERSAC
jgi:hypothetical protein